MNQPFTTYELTLDNIREILNIDDIKDIWATIHSTSSQLSLCKPDYNDHLMRENGNINNSMFLSRYAWLKTDLDLLKYYVLFCNRN